MRFLARSLLGIAFVAITLGLLVAAAGAMRGALEARASREPFARPAQERVVAARVVPVVVAEETPVTTAFGEVRAERELELRAPAAGRIAELAPEVVEGGRVRAGEVLARIDAAQAEAALARVRADVAGAEAELRDAERGVELAADDLASSEGQRALRERALARARDLAGRGVGTEAAIETAELALAAAEAAVLSRRQAEAAAQARRDRAEVALGRLAIDRAEAERALADLTVRAPFDGLLAEVSVTAGGLVAPNERLARLIDPASLEVAFRLSAAQRARLPRVEGLPVAVSLGLGLGDAPVLGRVVREAAEVGEGTTGRLLFAALGDSAGLRAGDFVTVELTETPIRGVARLPAAAVGADGQVLALTEESRLEALPAEIVRRQDAEVLIRAGELAGREVVAERSAMLGAGIRVEPVRPETPAFAEPETVALDDERRARLIAFVEGGRMPDEVKARMLTTLQQPEVPVRAVERIEARMGL